MLHIMSKGAEAKSCGVVQEGTDQALRHIAERLMWWQSAALSLGQPARFIAQVMVLGNWEEVQTTRQAFGNEALCAVLREAPPGVFDLRSWTYWHRVFRLSPLPPLPRRKL
jgi:hypothetical protein